MLATAPAESLVSSHEIASADCRIFETASADRQTKRYECEAAASGLWAQFLPPPTNSTATLTNMVTLLLFYAYLIAAPLVAVAFCHERTPGLPYRYVVARSRLTSCDLWPFRMSSGSSNDSSGGGRHLVDAGTQLQLAADSVGSQNMACPHLLSDAADALTEIGEYWSESWEAVTYAAEEASVAFHSLSNLQQRTELAALYKGVSSELRAISTIVGCTSIGPPSAVPNLAGLSHYLKEAGKLVEKEGECKDSKTFGKALRRASKSIHALAKEY